MNAYRVLGIDPALKNVGLCVLDSAKPGDYRVITSETIHPKDKAPMLDRLTTIWQGVERFVARHADGVSAIVVEDPTEQKAINQSRPRNIAVMGMAIGVALSPLLTRSLPVELIDVEEWMPRIPMARGGLTHIMPHGEMVRYLLGRIQCPAGVSEHVIFAAGVARYWIDRQRESDLTGGRRLA